MIDLEREYPPIELNHNHQMIQRLHFYFQFGIHAQFQPYQQGHDIMQSYNHH
jgi:hypothetical protein